MQSVTVRSGARASTVRVRKAQGEQGTVGLPSPDAGPALP